MTPHPPFRMYPDLAAFFADKSNGSQNDLAAELDIKVSMLSMIKRREREPSIALAARLIDRCHIPLESLARMPRKRTRTRKGGK